MWDRQKLFSVACKLERKLQVTCYDTCHVYECRSESAVDDFQRNSCQELDSGVEEQVLPPVQEKA
jgi:hypothetical protein